MKIIYSDKDEFKVVTVGRNAPVATVEPEELPQVMIEAIEQKTPEDIYFWEMGTFIIDILRVLYIGGYRPIYGDLEVKKMHEKEFKYLITSDLLPYTITIKRRKKGVRIINADNICREVGNIKVLLELLSYAGEKRRAVTISSIARRIWREFGSNSYAYLCTVLPNACKTEVYDGCTLDEYIRDAYRGGFLYDNAEGLKVYKDVYVYDKNSLYPYIATHYPLPYGNFRYKQGGPTEDEFKDMQDGYLYAFMKIRISFDVKYDGVPCIRLKYDDGQRLTHETGYLTTSRTYMCGEYGKDMPLELTITQDDYYMIIDNYNIHEIEFLDMVTFPTATGLFADYMTHFYEEKAKAGERGDKIARTVNKSLINNCIGTTAKKVKFENVTIDFHDDDEFVEFKIFESYGRESQVYIGTAVNAIARRIIVGSIKKDPKAWLYSDTDCKHVTRKIKDERIGKEMGEYKLEEHFKEVIYYKRKTYIGVRDDGSAKVVIAGLQKKSTDLIAKLIEERPKDLEYRESFRVYKLVSKVVTALEGCPFFVLYDEFCNWTPQYQHYVCKKLQPLATGTMSWQDMSEEQARALKAVTDILIKHGDITESEVFDFIEGDTLERKLYSDFLKIFAESDSMQEILVKLYSTPIPKYETSSDGYFNRVERVRYIRLDRNYNFL